MEQENKQVFEESKDTVEVQQQELVSEGLSEPTLSDKSPDQVEEEYGVRDKCDGKVLTVKEWGFTKPVTKDREGNAIEPKESKNGSSKYYTIKLKLRFEEDNLIEFYPSINQFVNDGKLSSGLSIYREGNSKISQIFRQAICHMSKGKYVLEKKKINERETLVIPEAMLAEYKVFEKTLSDKEVLDYLVGKQVKMELVEGIFEGNSWYRNDIIEIL